MGPCDILINNVSLLRSGWLAELDLAGWNALLAVNLTGYFLCAQASWAQMQAKGAGAPVHVASIHRCLHAPDGGGDICGIARNCRSSVEMIEKFYADYITTTLDADCKRRTQVSHTRGRRASAMMSPSAALLRIHPCRTVECIHDRL